MTSDRVKQIINELGAISVTPELSRNAIRYLDMEAKAGRLILTHTGGAPVYVTKQYQKKVNK